MVHARRGERARPGERRRVLGCGRSRPLDAVVSVPWTLSCVPLDAKEKPRMRIRRHVFVMSLCLAAFGLGCASDGGVDVSTTFDPLTRFPARATYVWDTAANQLPDDPRITALDPGPVIEE